MFLAFGPMTTMYQPYVDGVVRVLEAEGVRALALDETLPHGMTGCYGHPSAADNAEIAAKIRPVLAQALGW